MTRVNSVSRSSRAGLQFPVSRILRKMRDSNIANRYGQNAPIFLAAVLEYLTAEVLELSGNAAHDCRKGRINPRHIQLATRSDEELAKLLQNCTIPESGVLPHIHMALLNTAKDVQRETKSQSSSSSSSASSAKKPTKKSSKSPAKPKKTSKRSSTTAPATEGGQDAPEANDGNGIRWQYYDNGWKYYEQAAADVVEEAYQDYVKDPGQFDVRAIKSGHWMYQVDFANMKQTNIQHEAHTVREIRRVWRLMIVE